jgi:glycine/D-amino acid oxidase-like deaminating enzyme
MNEPMNFDLVAIGGGFAGICAAVRGAELGLRTAVLEAGAGEGYLCSSRWAGGIFHVSYHDVVNRVSWINAYRTVKVSIAAGAGLQQQRGEIGVDGELDALGALLAIAQAADGRAFAKERTPLLRPKLYLPYRELQALVVL